MAMIYSLALVHVQGVSLKPVYTTKKPYGPQIKPEKMSHRVGKTKTTRF